MNDSFFMVVIFVNVLMFRIILEARTHVFLQIFSFQFPPFTKIHSLTRVLNI